MQRGSSHRRHSTWVGISAFLLLVVVLSYLGITTQTTGTNNDRDTNHNIVQNQYTSSSSSSSLTNDIVTTATVASDTTWNHNIDHNQMEEDTIVVRHSVRRQLQTPPIVEVKGELRKWHKVTLAILGPMTSENDTNNNPFTNYRLDVTFVHTVTGTSYKVPGYYATDGDAANTSEKDGNVWYVHFAPDEIGTWTYTIDFKTGLIIAVQPNQVGAPVFPAHMMTGTFNILDTDKTGRDHRGKGRLKYVGRHHFQFQETKEYFLKAGSDR